MEAQKWIFAESFGYCSFKDAKEIQFVTSVVMSINSSVTWRGRTVPANRSSIQSSSSLGVRNSP